MTDVIEYASDAANDQRGVRYHDVALEFAQVFPVGTMLRAEEFDEWAFGKELLPRPKSREKQSDSWLAHLQRRHQLRYNINKASTHPRVLDAGVSTFTIDALDSLGSWEVRPPRVALSRDGAPKQLSSLIGTKRKRLGYLMQSADWPKLSPADRVVAEALMVDIDNYRERIEMESRQLADKFRRLEHRLALAVATGEIKPVNGGIRNLIEGPKD